MQDLQHAASIAIEYHSMVLTFILQKEAEEVYKLWPANKTDHLCQSWQSCHNVIYIPVLPGKHVQSHDCSL